MSKCESEFNCSIFLVKKPNPNGGAPKFRIVQNLKGLNAATKPSSFRLNRIDECLDRIAMHKSKVFSSLDLRSGYWNVEILPKDRFKTAFWVENIGQLAWNVSAQGLVNLPASFSRIIHRIFRTQIEKNQVENYLDDLLAHAKTHSDMLEILKDVFSNLRSSGLKINLQKCSFGAENLVYLGFNINKDGYSPSPANIRTITNTKEPNSVKLVKSFIGLLNFYHGSLPNYSALIKPLSKLTSNKSTWHGGPLPPEAKAAYEKAKEIMSKTPFIFHPNFAWKFHVFSDGSLGQIDAKNGGISGMLCQFENDDMTKPPRCIGFCSRSLRDHELGYSSFLVQCLGLSFTLDHFRKYLEGVHFEAWIDHAPMLKLGKDFKNNNQKRSHLRLKEQLAQFSFTLHHIEGSKNPCDYHSRNSLPYQDYEQTMKRVATLVNKNVQHKEVLSSQTEAWSYVDEKISKANVRKTDKVGAAFQGEHSQGPYIGRLDLIEQFQKTDPFVNKLKDYIKRKELPTDPFQKRMIKNYAPDCYVHNNIVFISFQQEGQLKRELIVAPGQIQAALVAEAHCNQLFGHDKAAKTLDRLLNAWWWPGIASDTIDFVAECEICRKNAKKSDKNAAYLKHSDTPSKIFEQINTDLFGPLIGQDGTKKFICTLVDQYSKHAEFCIIPNKSAEQVANAIFTRWICRFGVPARVTSDRGLEYRNELFDQLCKLLKIEHRFASVQTPQSNASAEVLNKKIAAYFKAMLNDHPTHWEILVPAMQFSYNSAITRATKLSPFFMLYGVNPRTVLNAAHLE